MKTCYSETCTRLDCRTCPNKSNLELETQNDEILCGIVNALDLVNREINKKEKHFLMS
jgi:hypothetical protein